MDGQRELRPGQRSQLWIGGPELATPLLLCDIGDLLIEAPNWSRDGRTLYVNGDGRLWAIDLADPRPRAITFDGLPPINNDHVLAPDGETIYLSAMDGHIYRGPLAGGPVARVTSEDGRWHFLHGVRPDGRELAWVQLAGLPGRGQLAVGPAAGGPSRVVDVGPGHLDGPEWSPDGAWIYLNTEAFTTTPGHAQLARIAAGGGAPERLVASETVDWFPHLSPDGRYATYLSFPPGTLGHPENLAVEVRVVSTSDWSRPLRRYPLFGGQGTINVNSWSPTSDRFAYLAYPVTAPS